MFSIFVITSKRYENIEFFLLALLGQSMKMQICNFHGIRFSELGANSREKAKIDDEKLNF